WEADVRIAGPVGSMGQRVLQPIVNQQVQHVLNALDKQVQEAAAGAEPGDAAGGASGAASTKEPSPGEPAPEAGELDDYGPPAEPSPDPRPHRGTTAAARGVSPWAPQPSGPE